MLPVPLSSTPFQLPVNVLLLTVARDPSNTVIAPEPCSGWYSPPVNRPDVVHAQVGHVPDEQAVLDRGPAAVQKIEGRSRHLRAVVAEDAVAEEHGILRLPKVLDRDAAAAGARVVPGDLDLLNRGIGRARKP